MVAGSNVTRNVALKMLPIFRHVTHNGARLLANKQLLIQFFSALKKVRKIRKKISILLGSAQNSIRQITLAPRHTIIIIHPNVLNITLHPSAARSFRPPSPTEHKRSHLLSEDWLGQSRAAGSPGGSKGSDVGRCFRSLNRCLARVSRSRGMPTSKSGPRGFDEAIVASKAGESRRKNTDVLLGENTHYSLLCCCCSQSSHFSN
jgi:hypothetical protein